MFQGMNLTPIIRSTYDALRQPGDVRVAQSYAKINSPIVIPTDEVDDLLIRLRWHKFSDCLEVRNGCDTQSELVKRLGWDELAEMSDLLQKPGVRSIKIWMKRPYRKPRASIQFSRIGDNYITVNASIHPHWRETFGLETSDESVLAVWQPCRLNWSEDAYFDMDSQYPRDQFPQTL